MMGWIIALAPIIVAIISGPTMLMLKRFDRRNSDQHAANMKVLTDLRTDVHNVASDMREVKADVRDLKAEHRNLAEDHRRLAHRFDRHEEG